MSAAHDNPRYDKAVISHVSQAKVHLKRALAADINCAEYAIRELAETAAEDIRETAKWRAWRLTH